MKNFKYILLTISGISVLLFYLWFFYFKDVRENKLIKKGNDIVEKIELFKQKHNRLPISLEYIGIEEEQGANAIYYDVRSNSNYTVSFMVSIDYNKFYYSDTKQWENGYRKMKTEIPNKEELLAGKEYKYWIEIGGDSTLKHVDYFDRSNVNMQYWYNNVKKKFYLSEFDDVLYYPTWKFINDTLIDIRTDTCIIKKLTETDFVYLSLFFGKEFHYQVAPLEIIPEEYRKAQEVPEILR